MNGLLHVTDVLEAGALTQPSFVVARVPQHTVGSIVPTKPQPAPEPLAFVTGQECPFPLRSAPAEAAEDTSAPLNFLAEEASEVAVDVPVPSSFVTTTGLWLRIEDVSTC